MPSSFGQLGLICSVRVQTESKRSCCSYGLRRLSDFIPGRLLETAGYTALPRDRMR